jgi:hypothetical protein
MRLQLLSGNSFVAAEVLVLGGLEDTTLRASIGDFAYIECARCVCSFKVRLRSGVYGSSFRDESMLADAGDAVTKSAVGDVDFLVALEGLSGSLFPFQFGIVWAFVDEVVLSVDDCIHAPDGAVESGRINGITIVGSLLLVAEEIAGLEAVSCDAMHD